MLTSPRRAAVGQVTAASTTTDSALSASSSTPPCAGDIDGPGAACRIDTRWRRNDSGQLGAHIRFNVVPFHRSTRSDCPCRVVREPKATHQDAREQATAFRELEVPTPAPLIDDHREPSHRWTTACGRNVSESAGTCVPTARQAVALVHETPASEIWLSDGCAGSIHEVPPHCIRTPPAPPQHVNDDPTATQKPVLGQDTDSMYDDAM
jgi:hypothetical protein